MQTHTQTHTHINITYELINLTRRPLKTVY